MPVIPTMLDGSHRDQRYIIHMDQIPIFVSMLSQTTLNTAGPQTVHVRTSTNSTMRVTAALTITASGIVLPTMFVFKRKPGGSIEREFRDFLSGGEYCVQEKAWIDEFIMKTWIDSVLSPCIRSAAHGIRPILILDSYRCHLRTCIVNAISEIGVQVKHISGGLTGLNSASQ